MAEYDIAFGEKLADVARLVVNDGLDTLDAKRAVLYLSLLATEITLKALLEKAGKPVPDIRARSHNLRTLLEDVTECMIQGEVAPGVLKQVPAMRLRSVNVDPNYGDATVGRMLEAEDAGASKYPNQVRYGNSLRHYPPELISKMSSDIVAWAKQHWDDIHVR